LQSDSERSAEREWRNAIEELSRKLHEEMERLDPTEDPEWGKLSDVRKEFYRCCLKKLTRERSLMLTAIYFGIPTTTK
jgi:hypothetical protein